MIEDIPEMPCEPPEDTFYAYWSCQNCDWEADYDDPRAPVPEESERGIEGLLQLCPKCGRVEVRYFEGGPHDD